MVSSVTFTVFRYFLFPKIRDLVLPGRESVSVPKIAVHEHGDPGLSENNVRLAGQIFDVLAEPQSSSVKSRAYPYFKAGILALDAGHTEAALFGCQVVRHQFCP